jgi:hypothetical protein
MALSKAYVFVPGQIADFFKAIQEGHAPEHFTSQHLKDLGFASSNHRALIPLMKALGFLSADGQPTQRYHDYRDVSQSRRVMGDALKQAYGDLFLIRAQPTEKDRAVFEGKFKSSHNVTDALAKRMSNTFFSLLALADIGGKAAPQPSESPSQAETPEQKIHTDSTTRETNLHYNIQIHLPATKDIEVFNAIFKSLREHLIE